MKARLGYLTEPASECVPDVAGYTPTTAGPTVLFVAWVVVH